MTTQNPPADYGRGDSQPSPAATGPAAERWGTSRQWRRGAFLLAGAAQLITISAIIGSDPIPNTWSALLLAVAPALLTGAALVFPARIAIPSAAAAAVATVVGMVQQGLHTGLFFVPSLLALVVGTIKLRREQP